MSGYSPRHGGYPMGKMAGGNCWRRRNGNDTDLRSAELKITIRWIEMLLVAPAAMGLSAVVCRFGVDRRSLTTRNLH
ncbi:hypothetical protein M011DRAFT_310273 [Sporormia fimetaria CBS 119925]|uniref:Uncharacterized protein n=1 Tax=Sporormia fimetaria CBS 119925 TaxID=1340428 RepID=A0A6A6VFX5_9PLEO|nr:hypothetical protein M011DRAFT_310273 [Sporormia fimetaria CBS 119925]